MGSARGSNGWMCPYLKCEVEWSSATRRGVCIQELAGRVPLADVGRRFCSGILVQMVERAIFCTGLEASIHKLARRCPPTNVTGS